MEQIPLLRYQRLGACVAELVASHVAHCLAVSGKVLALGTEIGDVHVLDYSGNEVQRYDAHSSPVNCLSLDEGSEYVASCSDEGSVVINSLYTSEVLRFDFRTPVMAVALDPRYGHRKTREFVCAGQSGQLTMSSRGWLGSKNTVLHSGEGAITAIIWVGALIVWANATSVKLFSTSQGRIIGGVLRPPNAAPSAPPRLVWEAPNELYIAWGSNIKVCQVVEHTVTVHAGLPSTQQRLVTQHSFDTDFLCCGIAPLGSALAVLAYVTEGGEAAEAAAEAERSPTPHDPPGTEPGAADSTAPDVQPSSATSPGVAGGQALCPELKIMSRRGKEISSDALPIVGYAATLPVQYSLAAWHPAPSSSCQPLDSPPTRESAASMCESFPPGQEPSLFMVAPRDVVLARTHDVAERVEWFAARERYEEALEQASAHETALPAGLYDRVAKDYLARLLDRGEFEAAAERAPRLLRGDQSAWEVCVYTFAEKQQLPLLAPFVPTSAPRLRSAAYEMVVNALLLSPPHHQGLLELVGSWPSEALPTTMLMDRVLRRLAGPAGSSPTLMEVMAALYLRQGRPDLSLAILLRLRKPAVLEFIPRHNLWEALAADPEGPAALLQVDPEAACALMLEHLSELPPVKVVASLQAAAAGENGGDEAARRQLHRYLSGVCSVDMDGAAPYHDLQVELCASYAPEELMPFLLSSSHYDLAAAKRVTEAAGLVRETVFILGRMGCAKQALTLILGQMKDVPLAIDFVQSQGDNELWEDLTDQAAADPQLTGALLDHLGGHRNPVGLIKRLRPDMQIPDLRQRLIKILSDFRTQASLCEGCHSMLLTDANALAQRLYIEARMALRLWTICEVQEDAGPPGTCLAYDGVTGCTVAVGAVPEEPGSRVEIPEADAARGGAPSMLVTGSRCATSAPGLRIVLPEAAMQSL